MSSNEEKDTLPISVDEQNDEQSMPLANASPKMQRFVNLYMTGQYSVNKLAQLLELHPNTLHKWLKREDVSEAISDIQEMNQKVVNNQMRAMSSKAIDRMRDLMDSPIDGVALQAVKDILDRSGHKPKTVKETNVNVRTYEEKLEDLIDDVIDGEWEDVE